MSVGLSMIPFVQNAKEYYTIPNENDFNYNDYEMAPLFPYIYVIWDGICLWNTHSSERLNAPSYFLKNFPTEPVQGHLTFGANCEKLLEQLTTQHNINPKVWRAITFYVEHKIKPLRNSNHEKDEIEALIFSNPYIKYLNYTPLENYQNFKTNFFDYVSQKAYGCRFRLQKYITNIQNQYQYFHIYYSVMTGAQILQMVETDHETHLRLKIKHQVPMNITNEKQSLRALNVDSGSYLKVLAYKFDANASPLKVKILNRISEQQYEELNKNYSNRVSVLIVDSK